VQGSEVIKVQRFSTNLGKGNVVVYSIFSLQSTQIILHHQLDPIVGMSSAYFSSSTFSPPLSCITRRKLSSRLQDHLGVDASSWPSVGCVSSELVPRGTQRAQRQLQPWLSGIDVVQPVMQVVATGTQRE
jgi:hypothetical protein